MARSRPDAGSGRHARFARRAASAQTEEAILSATQDLAESVANVIAIGDKGALAEAGIDLVVGWGIVIPELLDADQAIRDSLASRDWAGLRQLLAERTGGTPEVVDLAVRVAQGRGDLPFSSSDADALALELDELRRQGRLTDEEYDRLTS